MEPCRPCAARGFHTFHTFHTFSSPRAHVCTRTRVYLHVHLQVIFSMEGMEGMEEEGAARVSGFHTFDFGCGRYGTYRRISGLAAGKE